MSFSVGALLGACLLAAAHGVSLRSSAVGFFDADPATVVSCAPLAKVVGRAGVRECRPGIDPAGGWYPWNEKV